MFIENSNLTSIIYLFYLFYANPHCLLCRLITMLSMPAGRQLQTVGWDHLTVSLRTTDSVIDKVGWRWKSNVEGEAKVAGRMSPHSDYDCHFEFGFYQFKHEEELCLVFSNRYSYIEQTRRQWMGSKHRRQTVLWLRASRRRETAAATPSGQSLRKHSLRVTTRVFCQCYIPLYSADNYCMDWCC